IRSIFGECSGNVRSTPTPNDCLRTVKVSRTPEPCFLITIPSNTWMRRRWPSITWKWTRTVSPALNRGTSRSCSRSSLSIVVLMEGVVDGDDRGRVAGTPPDPALLEPDALRWPVDREDLADDVLARHRAPPAGVARRRAVVAHEEVPAAGDLQRRGGFPVAARGGGVGGVQPPSLAVEGAAPPPPPPPPQPPPPPPPPP